MRQIMIRSGQVCLNPVRVGDVAQGHSGLRRFSGEGEAAPPNGELCKENRRLRQPLAALYFSSLDHTVRRARLPEPIRPAGGVTLRAMESDGHGRSAVSDIMYACTYVYIYVYGVIEHSSEYSLKCSVAYCVC